MRRLIIVSAFVCGLAGCSEPPPNPPLPERVCVEKSAEEVCGKGGCYNKCLRYGVGCPVPLELAQRSEGDFEKPGALYCRMPKTPVPPVVPVN